jgi:hypothetical protein
MNNRDSDLLFFRLDMFSVIEHQRQLSLKEVEQFNANQLLNTPTDDVVEAIVSRHRLDVPEIHREQAYVDQKEAQVPILDYFSHDEMGRGIRHVTGTMIELTVPFSGDGEMFQVRPTTFNMNPPRASISHNNLIIRVSGQNLSDAQVKDALNNSLKEIDQFLTWQRGNANEFNANLPTAIRSAIEARKAKLLRDQNLIANLGFPMKPRTDAPKTYIAPQVRRKITLVTTASTAQFKPEPVLDEENYKHILNVVENMTVVMERSPTAFANMREEDIRQHLLVQLNGHFEGAATGETFNFQGKTDILIRVDGQNIFIAECKFWRGEKSFREAIDQILSYLSWRDTKAAIILFNRTRNFSSVLSKIKGVVGEHEHKKRGPVIESETRFRYIFGNPSDHNREIILTVVAFDVPTEASDENHS